MSETPGTYQVKNKNPTTNNNMRNRFSACGLEILKQVVLDVLYHAEEVTYRGDQKTHRKPLLQPEEIRKRLGLKHSTYTAGTTNALILGVLAHLHDDGHVYHEVSYGWIITDNGIAFVEK
ncbi:MAG: hypothetical protein OXH00_03005 [Candidatus Poribacteria bacterium]|nr:hypothetical protein [Candidatus Poribacteria bacterium]